MLSGVPVGKPIAGWEIAMTTSVLISEIAKDIFQLHGEDPTGKPVTIVSKPAITSINRLFSLRKPSSTPV